MLLFTKFVWRHSVAQENINSNTLLKWKKCSTIQVWRKFFSYSVNLAWITKNVLNWFLVKKYSLIFILLKQYANVNFLLHFVNFVVIKGQHRHWRYSFGELFLYPTKCSSVSKIFFETLTTSKQILQTKLSILLSIFYCKQRFIIFYHMFSVWKFYILFMFTFPVSSSFSLTVFNNSPGKKLISIFSIRSKTWTWLSCLAENVQNTTSKGTSSIYLVLCTSKWNLYFVCSCEWKFPICLLLFEKFVLPILRRAWFFWSAFFQIY